MTPPKVPETMYIWFWRLTCKYKNVINKGYKYLFRRGFNQIVKHIGYSRMYYVQHASMRNEYADF